MFDSFPVCRTIFDHWIYENPDYLKIWITMLGRARYSKEVKKGLYLSVGYELKYAQFIFGRTQWSRDLRIGEQKIRTCIKKMVTDNMILLTTRSIHFSIYEIVNYAKYNHPNYLETQAIEDTTNQLLTSWQPATNQLVTTKEEGIKKDKKDKNVIYSAIAQFKPPEIEEVKEYCLKRNNNVDANKWHDFYSSKGWMVGKNKMKDWKAAVRTWEHKEGQDKFKTSNIVIEKAKRDKYEKFYL